MTEPTEAALGAFVARNLGDLAALGGLPEGQALDRVAAELGADPGRMARWFLGDPPEEAFWCPAVGIDGFDDTIKVWFRDGVVVKLTGEWPELAPADAEPLGPPDLRLDHRTDAPTVDGDEQVWADLGIALTFNRLGSTIVGLSAFVPTTPEEYRVRLADVREYREAPAPDG